MTDTTTLTPRQEAAVDLFTTAVEGGINYWAQVGEYRWSEKWTWEEKGCYVYEFGDNEDPADPVRLTPALMLTGLGRLVKDNPTRRTNCGGTFLALSMTLGKDDQEDYDAGDADVIAQFALGLCAVSEYSHGHLMETYG